MTTLRIGLRALFLLSALCVLTPGIAFARQPNRWNVDLSPINSWNASAKGNLAINGVADTPLSMNFSDAKSRTARGSAVHGEVRKGKWGIIGDVNFIHLSSDVNYSDPHIELPITGTLQMDQVMFNGKGTF